MRPFIVAVAAVLALTATGIAGDGAKKPLKKKSSEIKKLAEEPVRDFPAPGIAKGVIVAADDANKSFDLRTAKGILRVRKYESVRFVDRLGEAIEGMTPSKAKEQCYMTIVMTDGTVPSAGSFKFFFTIEALP